MQKKSLLIFLILALTTSVRAQYDRLSSADGQTRLTGNRRGGAAADTTKNKEIPRGLRVWTVDELTGETTPAEPDTTSYLRMNHVFASGLHGEYNTLGVNGSPRQNRIFTDRDESNDFIFTNGYTQTIVPPGDFHFTNTFSPITNLQYNQCGNRTNGEDHFKTIFAVNASKQLGFGFKFDYLYARGFYADQNTSHFNYTMWGSYMGDRYQAHLLLSTNHQKASENGGIANDDYVKHPEIFADDFTENEIPTVFTSNWNRHDNQHVFFSQRYNVGFNRRVPMTEQEREAKKFAIAAAKEKAEREAKKKAIEEGREVAEEETTTRTKKKTKKESVATGRPTGAKIAGDEPAPKATPTDTTRIALTTAAARDSIKAEKQTAEEDEFMKDEYVPVTSFFHTLTLDHYKRTYIAYESPAGYYKDDFYALDTDSISDLTTHTHIRNNLGISLLEGFNKWAKAGVRVYAAHELKHFTLPNIDGTVETWNENNILVGGGLSRREGKTLHFNVTGEVNVAGTDAGQIQIDGGIDLRFPLLGDTVSLNANGAFHLLNPGSYLVKYRSRHFQWDMGDAFDKETRTHIEGNFAFERLGTHLRLALDNITNYTYLSTSYDLGENDLRLNTTIAPRQAGSVQVITAQLFQNLHTGILHWDNILTYQKTTDEAVLPLPQLNVYTNLYLRFKIAKVLQTDFGVDARYFTKYDAPEYAPQVQSYVVQENEAVRTQVGNYPICNIYANFQLKNCRFFFVMSHVNCSGKGDYFLTPHHPLNGRMLRFGLNWNFFN